MRLKRTRRPLRPPGLGSSYSTPGEIDTDQLLRVSCCMIVQCFREGQGIDEIIDGIRPRLESVLQMKREKTPRRRIANEHQNEIKNFIETVGCHYRLIGADRTGEHTPRFHSADDAIGQMGNADVGSDSSPEFTKEKRVRIDAFLPGSNRHSRVPRARCLRNNANRNGFVHMDRTASNDGASTASDDEISIISATMSEEPLFVVDGDGGVTDVQSVDSTTTEPQTSCGRDTEDMVSRKRLRVLVQ